MEATEMLVEEHKAIKRVLAVLQQAARDLGDGKQHSPEVFEQAVDFIRNFADKCLNSLAHLTRSFVGESDRQNSHRMSALAN